jgi:hypothetical protein
MEAERRRAMERAEQVEKDMRELERLVSEYNLLVVAPLESFTPPKQQSANRAMLATAQKDAEAVIRAAGRPMQISELFQILADRSIILGGSDPVSSLSHCLIRYHRLQYIPKIGWWVRGVSWPPKPDEVGKIINPPQEPSGITRPRRRRRTPEKERLYQELRKFLEGRKQPTPFREIFDHIKDNGVPIGGQDERQNLSAFMTSIHEFKTHGAEGRAGWTFEADEDWSVVGGFGTEKDRVPPWRHTPERQKLFETIRAILRGRTERMKYGELFDRVKKSGVPIGGTNERDYLALYLWKVPCFRSEKKDESGHAGWVYVPELDEETKGLGARVE